MSKDSENKHLHELSKDIDPKKDQEKLKEQVTEIKLPDVSDIPGQENIKPMPPGEMADVTASSADEEGEDVFENDIDEEVMEQDTSNVSAEEKRDLFRSARDMPGDDDNLRRAALDATDEDGTPLNEDSFKKNISPDDLDVPGASLDDEEERIGEEDEENNEYSLGGDNEPGQEGSPRDEF